MSDRDLSELEQRLREALRPVEPPAGFAAHVMAALARARLQRLTAPARLRSGAAWPRKRRAWLSAAAAFALAVVLVGTGLWGSHRAQELRAREARAQALEALRISSETLNSALHVTVDPSRSG
jgi:hypothetical protein